MRAKREGPSVLNNQFQAEFKPRHGAAEWMRAGLWAITRARRVHRFLVRRART